MGASPDPNWLRILGRTLGGLILVGALALGYLVTRVNYLYPRTDDATVTANVVGIAPHVSGALVELNVADDQEVKPGDLLFAIDSQPYAVAAARANATLLLARSDLEAISNSIASADSAVNVREAELQLAIADVKRYEPLLASQAIDALTVDVARTRQRTAQAQLEEARQNLLQQQNLLGQFGSLNARIGVAEADLHAAQINLDYCRVSAPFPARVANLSISAGEFAREGQPIFALVDTRDWYVVANFRETFLESIHPGQAADVYLMAYPHRCFHGTVQGVGWAVQTPDSAPNGALMGVSPTLNWIRLAQRLPVRIRLDAPDPKMPYRMGMTAVVTLRKPATRAPEAAAGAIP
ncbi:MAG: biotin/lipoyl-binding protein [Verrucomicrobiia bacterium]